ncbi:MAG TPA: MnhB domain-containing protein [Terriglobales bacterium]|nr:MnhB domain-containing protein [Terriglobales bacterium]
MSSLRDSIQNPVIEGVAKFLVPYIQVFAVYVITHGHYGPGGGFQGGMILAASMMLLRLSLGEGYEHRRFSPEAATCAAATGLLIYALAGFLPMVFGGDFLAYAALPIPGFSRPELRYYGILIVECGVALAVWGTMVTLFDHLLGGRDS